jgi:hypothetical protein
MMMGSHQRRNSLSRFTRLKLAKKAEIYPKRLQDQIIVKLRFSLSKSFGEIPLRFLVFAGVVQNYFKKYLINLS